MQRNENLNAPPVLRGGVSALARVGERDLHGEINNSPPVLRGGVSVLARVGERELSLCQQRASDGGVR